MRGRHGPAAWARAWFQTLPELSSDVEAYEEAVDELDDLADSIHDMRLHDIDAATHARLEASCERFDRLDEDAADLQNLCVFRADTVIAFLHPGKYPRLMLRMARARRRQGDIRDRFDGDEDTWRDIGLLESFANRRRPQ